VPSKPAAKATPTTKAKSSYLSWWAIVFLTVSSVASLRVNEARMAGRGSPRRRGRVTSKNGFYTAEEVIQLEPARKAISGGVYAVFDRPHSSWTAGSPRGPWPSVGSSAA